MGSVRRRPDVNGRPGGWLARWREPDGTQRKKSFKLRREAEAFLLTVEVSTRDGTYVPPRAGRETIGDYGARYVERQTHLTAKSHSSLRSLWRSQVEPRWGRVPLDRVRYDDVADWVASMVADGLSASRARQSYHCLTAILDDAVKARKISRNEAASVDLPRLTSAPKRYLTHGQLHRLAEACGAFRLFVLMLGYCGARWGEAIALRVRSFDPVRGRLLIEENAVDVDGEIIVGDPKDHELRTIPVPPFLVAELVEHVKGKPPDALLFTSPRGGYLRNQNARRQWWDPACAHRTGWLPACAAPRTANLGMPVELGFPGLTPHELRHTAASLAIAAGADVKMVQRMLGHAKASMTLDTYGHLWEDGLAGVAERLGKAAEPHLRPKRGNGSAGKAGDPA